MVKVEKNWFTLEIVGMDNSKINWDLIHTLTTETQNVVKPTMIDTVKQHQKIVLNIGPIKYYGKKSNIRYNGENYIQRQE